MAEKVYREIMNTFIGKKEPTERYNTSYAIVYDETTDEEQLPPSMEKMEFEDFGVGIVGIR